LAKKGTSTAATPKTFVLDTNVLLHNSRAISSFADNKVVIPIEVLEELDRFKSRNDELGRNAREVIRTLDRLRSGGSLREGIPLERGGELRIVMRSEIRQQLPDMDVGVVDNHILGVAYALAQKGERVVFISKDINARVKADAVGVVAEDFLKQQVNFESFYTGWREVETSQDMIDEFYKSKTLSIDRLDLDEALSGSEFVLLRDETNPKHTAVAKHDHGNGHIVSLTSDFSTVWNISPRSVEQRMAIELLLDDRIKLVTLVGRAGTGKTLLALAAGLDRVIKEHHYEKLLVSRPIMPMGKDIGYLPGAKEEKLAHWMQPIFDNLKYLMGGKKRVVNSTADKLVDSGTVVLEGLTYIRGRSISGQFLVVDEAQNLTPHEIKTIVSRAGEDTKLVLTGDPYQIDNPYLDSASNGLVYAAERLRESALVGHVVLTKSERSDLASLAAERL
jgi:PhoH-like ATPase